MRKDDALNLKEMPRQEVAPKPKVEAPRKPNRLERLSPEEAKALNPSPAVEYPQSVDGWWKFCRKMERKFRKACPRCREELVVRTNRSTKKPFIGCSGWPGCRYVENFDLKEVIGEEAYRAFQLWDRKQIEEESRLREEELLRQATERAIEENRQMVRRASRWLINTVWVAEKPEIVGHC
jgi:hypothetical protein